MQDISPNTPCSFASDAEDQDEVELSAIVPGPGVGMDEDLSIELIGTSSTPDALTLWPWVNQVC